jgi:hypothetical protein
MIPPEDQDKYTQFRGARKCEEGWGRGRLEVVIDEKPDFG